MAKPKNINLTDSSGITQEALLAYAEGRLSDAERVQMDKLLKDDPFAQDALEGMRTSSRPSDIHTVITRINTQLHERAGIHERKKKGIEIHWSIYAYAAVIIGVLIGVGFVLINIFSHQNDRIAMNSPGPKAEVSAPVVADQTKPKTDTIQQTAPVAISDSTSAKPASTASTNTSADSSQNKKMPPPAATAAYQTVASAQTAPSNNMSAPAAKKSMMMEQAPTTDVIGGEIAAQLGVARTFFEAGNYVDAEKKYDQILSSQPNNADALYFGGICSYLNGTKGLGEANFDRLAKSSLYPEGVKWYKANILIRKGKKDEARQMLRDLINSNSIYKERAVKLYEELYK